MVDCPHCGHSWDKHRQWCWFGTSADTTTTSHNYCGCRWPDPRPIQGPVKPRPPEYPYGGVISADILYKSFWTAVKTLGDDGSVHPMDHPYMDQEMDMVDTSGCGMPPQFWEHMAKALAESDCPDSNMYDEPQ